MRNLWIEGNGVSRAEFELFEANLETQTALDQITVFLAAMANQGILRARLGADLVDNIVKLGFRVGLRRKPFPPNALGEPDHLTGTAILDRADRVLLDGPGLRSAFGPMPISVPEQIVDTHFEVRRDRVQRPDG